VSSRGSVLPLLVALPVLACEIRSREAAPAGETVVVQPMVEAAFPLEPDTTGEAVLAWLDGERYRETWDLWPATAPLDPGAEAHGALLTTYVSPLAFDALMRGTHAMPPGAAVVVEDYMSDSSLSSISVMVRADGYDAERQDWFFARFGSAGEIDAAGRVEMCAGCHVSEPDYLFSGELGTPLPIDSTGATVQAADSL
jgi:hypothetical protein